MSIAFALAISIGPQAMPFPEGIYTNEEETYFDLEAKRTPAPWLGLRVDTYSALQIDKFGKPASESRSSVVAIKDMVVSDVPDRIRVTLADGRVTELRRARMMTCWGATLKAKKKSDGNDDWFGASKLKLHDQGGRVVFGGGDSGAPETILRMRNVVWPSGPNRPSLVLYVHTPAEPDRAISYGWADKDAKTVGINLRWMQASCTVDGIE